MSNHQIKEEIKSGGSIQNNGKPAVADKPAPKKPDEKEESKGQGSKG